MRGNELLDKMGLIDLSFVEAADAKPKKRQPAWVRWGAAAACLCLVAAGALMIPGIRPVGPGTRDLAPITIPELTVNGTGFEGVLYRDISELHTGNPWREDMDLETLPVYKNGAYDPSGAGVPVGLSEAEMEEKVERIVSSLGLETVSTEVASTQVRAVTDFGTVTVQADGSAVYWLPEGGLTLPEAYHFTNSDTSEDQAEAVLAYLADAYGALLRFEEPVAVSWGDYDIYGEFGRRYTVYDGAGDDLERLLSYNFRGVQFFPSDSGGLMAIGISGGMGLAEKIGDYPIVTLEEATRRLISGSYQTSVPVAFPGEEFIGKAELVYRTGRLDELLLPYYRFYVQLPDSVNPQQAAERGLKSYGVYYVPAVEEAYIANMPLYDGRFN